MVKHRLVFNPCQNKVDLRAWPDLLNFYLFYEKDNDISKEETLGRGGMHPPLISLLPCAWVVQGLESYMKVLLGAWQKQTPNSLDGLMSQ